MLAPQTKQTKSKSDLRTGVIAVSAGLGITLFFLALNGIEDNNLWGIGLIPLIIGIGYIVVWKMESKKGASETRES
jgi:cadmium resistance protein CadD (predicted permease)